MFKITIKILVIIFFTLSVTYAEKLTYHIKAGDISKLIRIEKKDYGSNYEVIMTETFRHKWLLKKNKTLQWQYSNKKESSELTVTKNEQNLNLSGKYRGKVVNLEYDLDDLPWIQSIDYFIPSFILNKKNIQFWYLRSRDLKPLKMELSNQGRQIIQLNGEKYDTQHLELSIKPWPKWIWKTEYWIDNKSGHIILKKRHASPSLIMELSVEK